MLGKARAVVKSEIRQWIYILCAICKMAAKDDKRCVYGQARNAHLGTTKMLFSKSDICVNMISQPSHISGLDQAARVIGGLKVPLITRLTPEQK